MKDTGENGLTIEQELEKYKRYLSDRDLEIKDLQEELDETKACYISCNKERTQLRKERRTQWLNLHTNKQSTY